MKVITVQQMQEIERRCEKEWGISTGILMKNAGTGVARWICNCLQTKGLPGRVIIVVGKGNNGGDGLVAAQVLAENGIEVDVVLLANERDLKGLVKMHLGKIKKKRKVRLHKVTKKSDLDRLSTIFSQSRIVVDGILGTGLKGEVRGISKEMIEFINSLDKEVISIDIPSGIDGNTGDGFCIRARVTLTLGVPKVGLYKPINQNKVGRVEVIDIGIPEGLLSEVRSGIEYIWESDFRGMLPYRRVDSHKGTYGKVLVIAGSPQYTGAPYLSAMGALRAGAGMVFLGVPFSLHSVFQGKCTEAITVGLPETEEHTLSIEGYNKIFALVDKCDCVIIGPGVGRNPDTDTLIKKLLTGIKDKPIVLDADGINAVIEDSLVLRKVKAPLVITPHPGEMARLLNTSVKGVQDDRWKIARSIADKFEITVVLKGAYTVVAGDDGMIYINSTGNPGMATAGSGDVLSGIIGAFIAQGFKPLDAARLGVWIHGYAGDIAAKERGEVGLIASDVLEKVPAAINNIYGK